MSWNCPSIPRDSDRPNGLEVDNVTSCFLCLLCRCLELKLVGRHDSFSKHTEQHGQRPQDWEWDPPQCKYMIVLWLSEA